MFLFIPTFCILFFLGARFVLPLKTARVNKLGLFLLVLSFALKFSFYYFLGGSVFAPDLSRESLIFLEGLMGAVFILVFLVLLRDVFLLLSRFLFKKAFTFHRQPKVALILLFFSFLLGQWGSFNAVVVPEIKEVSVFLPQLPQELENFKIVQLTDTHIRKLLNKEWLDQVMEKTNALNADVVLLTGDYTDASQEELKNEAKAFGELKAKWGVFGVTGNHEYYTDPEGWMQFFKEKNVQILNNAHAVLNVNGKNLILVGLPDPTQGRFGGEKQSLQKALKNAPVHSNADEKTPIILLNHQPKKAKEFAQHGVDVQLSGHTHGGVMFFLKPIVAAFNGGFVKGLYQVGTMQLYVSAGTGLWGGFSCRIGVPSEITVLTLRRGELTPRAK